MTSERKVWLDLLWYIGLSDIKLLVENYLSYLYYEHKLLQLLITDLVM